MFEQVFKNIDDILYKDPGADSELDYVAQTSWVLFLRYLDEIQKEKADEATLSDDKLKPLIELKYNTIADVKKVFGSPAAFRVTSIGFKKFLFNKKNS